MAPADTPATSTAQRKRQSRRKALLSSTRPKHAHSDRPGPLRSSAGRALIRTHHTLRKRLTAALASNDKIAVKTLSTEIESLGGLKTYQDASLAGQSKERGGDTSGVLVSWLSSLTNRSSDYRLLEVGALSVDNACGGSKIFGGGVERIDLKSRHPKIKEQDFMGRPLPTDDVDKFDVVSLSLVVNFVGDPKSRADMLGRVESFLRTRHENSPTGGDDNDKGGTEDANGEIVERLLPALFLVLPAPCVNNSRYMDEERLEAIMRALKYRMVNRKMSTKLVYYLWKYTGVRDDDRQRDNTVFGKEELRKGKERNNFAIVLK